MRNKHDTNDQRPIKITTQELCLYVDSTVISSLVLKCRYILNLLEKLMTTKVSPDGLAYSKGHRYLSGEDQYTSLISQEPVSQKINIGLL